MKRLVTAAVMFVASASLGLAAQIDIGGNYGDEPGCAFGKNPDTFIGSEYMLLTPEEWKTGLTSCDFVGATPAWEKYGNRIFVVTAICSGEGGDVTKTELLRVEKSTDEADTYAVFGADGAELGRGKRCS